MKISNGYTQSSLKEEIQCKKTIENCQFHLLDVFFLYISLTFIV
jgi:hypothetical protein